MKPWGVFLGGVLGLAMLLAFCGELASQASPETSIPYVGATICAGCHQELVKEWEKRAHGRSLMLPKREAAGKGCEECHGPGGRHVAGDTKAIRSPKKMKPAEAVQVCLPCHRSVVKASEWHISEHAAAKLVCTDCHAVHDAPKGPRSLRQVMPELCWSCHPSQRGEFRQNSHHPLLEGRLVCTDCHNPHRRTERENQARAAHPSGCGKCHPDKAGPFLFEHDLAAGDVEEGCLTCHRPHGSPNASLLKVAGRGLCQQCHIDMIQHQMGRGTCWSVGCHVRIHGSNADPRFLR